MECLVGIVALDASNAYTYVMMAAVDSDGNAMVGGTYKDREGDLLTVHCHDKVALN